MQLEACLFQFLLLIVHHVVIPKLQIVATIFKHFQSPPYFLFLMFLLSSGLRWWWVVMVDHFVLQFFGVGLQLLYDLLMPLMKLYGIQGDAPFHCCFRFYIEQFLLFMVKDFISFGFFSLTSFMPKLYLLTQTESLFDLVTSYSLTTPFPSFPQYFFNNALQLFTFILNCKSTQDGLYCFSAVRQAAILSFGNKECDDDGVRSEVGK